MTSLVSIKNLEKSYNHAPLYDKLSLEIEAGKITSILGPNGSGKSTLLNILSGITAHDGGQWAIKDFKHPEFSYVFQNYRETLFPWRTNYQNIAFPLEIQDKDEDFIVKRIKELQKIFGFECDWNSYPYELSGGQQQILAFMRALITNPKILFIDEPFSALDYENNLKLRKHLHAYYSLHQPTIVLITHNIEEAVHLSHRIVVFSAKPSTVAALIENTVPFPRTLETLKSSEFHKVKNTVLDAFRQAVHV